MADEQNKVVVIDSMMGTGKTSWALQFMDENPDESFIYCTPFLDEVTRIQTQSSRRFYEPNNYNNKRKIDTFNDLLMDGRDVCVTHCTFSNATDETIEYIRNGNYTLILDEVIDVLIDYNSVTNDNIKKGDISLLLNEGFISVNEYGKVKWLKQSYAESKYSDVERLARNGNLFYLDGSLLVWQFPPALFNAFKRVYLLTYLFKGSLLKPYFEYHNIGYELASVCKNANDRYWLSEWHDDRNQRRKYKALITLWDNQKANRYKAAALSKTWYSRQNEQSLSELKLYLYNYFSNVTSAKSRHIMWTCPKDYRKHLKGKGYTLVRSLTADEKKLPRRERENLEKKTSCFVACNARATNAFDDRTTLAYLYNVYPNPYIKRYFEQKNQKDGLSIMVDQDAYALSTLIQWTWRSAIRKPTPEPITLYIPSKRMRTLLMRWLNGEI